MYALVITRENLALPKGHISAVFAHLPSSYEVSPSSPWEVVEMEGPPSMRDGYRILLDGEWVLGEQKFRLNQERLVPPPTLPKGSLVWDYGPGRTYSSPQAAFDACVLYWAGLPIDSNQYIRGYGGGIYEGVDWALHLYGLDVPFELGHWLIVDGDTTLRAPYPIIGATLVDDPRVRGVKIQGMRLVSYEALGCGVAVSLPFLDYPSLFERLQIEECEISHETGEGVGVHGRHSGDCVVRRCTITGFERAVGTFDGETNDDTYKMRVYSSLLSAKYGIALSPSGIQFLFLANSLVKAESGFLQNDVGVVIKTLQNNIWDCSVDIFHTPEQTVVGVNVECDSNDYHAPVFADTKGGAITLEEYQLETGEDAHSIEADPLLDGNLMPAATSPVWRAGQAIGYADYAGRVIGRTVLDIGPYQLTKAEFYDPGECGYCTVAEVIEATGALAKDLDVADLEPVLCRWIEEVSNLIDAYCKTTWVIGVQPGGIRRAAISMASNVLQISIQRRKGPFIAMTEYSAKMVEDQLFTASVVALLDPYKIINTDTDFGIATFLAEDYA